MPAWVPESELWWMENNDPVASSSLSNVRGSAQLEPNVIFELLLHATADPHSTPPSCDSVESSFTYPGGAGAPFGVQPYLEVMN